MDNNNQENEKNNVEVLQSVSLTNMVNNQNINSFNINVQSNVNNLDISDKIDSENLSDVNSVDLQSAYVLDSHDSDILVQKSCGKMFFRYLLQCVKWIVCFEILSGVIIANIFNAFFSSYIFFWIILFLESYLIHHWALSDAFKNECISQDDYEVFLILLYIFYPIFFVIFVFVAIRDFYLLDMIFYCILGIISVVLNRKMIKTN